MKLRVLVRETLRGLVAARQRSGLAVLGIVVGIAAVIAITGVGSMARRHARAQFRDLGVDIVGVSWEGAGPSRVRAQDARLLRAAVPALAEAQPVLREAVRVTTGAAASSWTLLGVAPEFAALARLRLAEGRFLSPLDRAASFCVVGADLARVLRESGTAEVIGARLEVGERLFVITGVLAPRAPLPVLDAPLDRAVLVELPAASRLSGRESIDAVLARLAEGADERRTGEEIRRYFRQRGGLEVEVRAAAELLAQMNRQLRVLTLVLGIVGSIALVLGGVGVMNVMVLAVAERRHEIGVRRALGASRSDIGRQFLAEAMALSAVGGIAGAILGAVAAFGIASAVGWDYRAPWLGIALGLLAALVVGAVCGTYPARQAGRLHPIAALRG